MKKLLLIALVVGGIAFASAPKTEAGDHFRGFPIGFEYYGGCYPGYYGGPYGGGDNTGTYILTPATIAPIPITGWDIDITVIGINGNRYYGHRSYSRPYYWHNGRRVY